MRGSEGCPGELDAVEAIEDHAMPGNLRNFWAASKPSPILLAVQGVPAKKPKVKPRQEEPSQN
jgi:hypothetical protein